MTICTTVNRAAALLLLALVGCTTATAPPPGAITIDRNIAFPQTVDQVWYRTDKIRVLGLAYEATGTVVVTEDSIAFTHERGTITIARESIRDVVRGKLSPDITNDWVVVHHTDSGVSGIAAFKGALFAGGDRDSKLYSSFLQLLPTK